MKDHSRQSILQLLCFFGVISTSFGELEIIDLGTLGGTDSFAYAINDGGQVIGESYIAGDQERHLFLYDDGNLVDLSVVYNIGSGAYVPTVNDINSNGTIIGSIPNGDAAIFDGGVITDLGAFGGIFSKAVGINNAGQIVGYYSSPSFLNHAILYSGGTVTELGPFGPEATSIAIAINGSGAIVGYATDSFMVPYHAFLYANGVMTDISPFGNSESYARGISSHGQVVGDFLTGDKGAFHAFIYSNGSFLDIGSTDSPDTVAYAVNDRGLVVGTTFVPYEDVCFDEEIGEYYPCTHYKPHAFLYEHGAMTDLNSLLPGDSGWELTWARDVNNQRQIVGYGLVDGATHGFVIKLGDDPGILPER